MNRALALVAIASSITSAAWAQSQPAVPEATHDWGCEVLLCLANPDGPMAVAECVPPIRRLWRALAKGHAFPTCAMASGPHGRSFARPAHSYYDRCPSGTTELAPGLLAETSTTPGVLPGLGSGSTFTPATPGFVYTGIGSGDGYGPASVDNAAPPKVCVAGRRGERIIWSGDTSVTVQQYDNILVSPAHGSPRLIDIFINDSYWQSVRW
jgi:hypothetical protein